MSGAILSMKYQAILLPRQNRILPLCLILYFQKERRKMQILQKEAPTPTEAPAPAPAPASAPTLETVEE